ncbi:MAG TPA: HTH domain-containing protein [Blastocatellia bacterium]|nr:HTH domain-containing protein [Blastocatellia bacterium]
MHQWTFLELAKRVLEEEKKPLSPEEIWNLAIAKGYDKNLGSQGKTPLATLGARLYVDVKRGLTSPFISTDSRPKRFFLRSLLTESSEQKILEAAQSPVIVRKKIEYLEKDLHPFLAFYGYHYMRAYLKTIHHSKSDKKEYGEWVHPDMVGCYYPFGEWKDEVVGFSSVLGSIAIKLFSFELKRTLNFSNLREAFFQAVSNSSWANEGYLAAAEISNDDDFLNELKRLSTSFGIGVIRIDIEDPDSTEVIFPAKPKEFLDWDAINKLTMNPDFKEFLKRVRIDISSKEIREEMYDKILSKEDLPKIIRSHKPVAM